MDHVMFLLFRAYFITLMTSGNDGESDRVPFRAPEAAGNYGSVQCLGGGFQSGAAVFRGRTAAAPAVFDYHFSAGNGSYLLGSQ